MTFCEVIIIDGWGLTAQTTAKGPLEALEIAMPSGAIMDALSGGEFGWKDTFEENYGEYFEHDDDTQ